MDRIIYFLYFIYMVKYSKKRNLNNRKVTRHNSKKRNNFKKNTRNRKVSKKGGATEKTPGQSDYNNFFNFLICIKNSDNQAVLDPDFYTSYKGLKRRELIGCSIFKKITKDFFPNLTPKEFQKLFNHYVEFCYVVSEDSKTIKITSEVTEGLIYYNKTENYKRYGFNQNGVNNNNYTAIKAFENTNEGKQALFEYFQGKYLQDAKDLGIKK